VTCPRPDKDVFWSWRDARRAVRRIRAQEKRWLEPYLCEDHLHLTKVDAPTPIMDLRERKPLRHRYLNRTGRAA
jgi:hypothetical protein